jgi:hypothetical protein
MEPTSDRSDTGPPGRFHDPGDRLEAFLDEVLVVCPRCAALARVTPTPGAAASSRPALLSDRRLVCAECALVRSWPAPGARRTCVTGTDVDPWFGRPLWLRAEVVGHALWAYNLRHLIVLEGYIGATQRTKDRNPGMIHTMLNRLPTWMKEARHRDQLLAALAGLRASVRS